MQGFSPFSWMINRLNYIQTYILVCALFSLSLLPMGYFWVKNHIQRIDLIDLQLTELDEENLYRRLYDLLQQHRFYAQNLFINNQDLRLELETTQAQISDILQQLYVIAQQETKEYQSPLSLIWQQVDLDEMTSKWKALNQQFSQLSPEKNEILHTALINDLSTQFGYLSDKLNLEFPSEMDNYALVEGMTSRLAVIQEHISQLTLAVDELHKTANNSLRERISIFCNETSISIAFSQVLSPLIQLYYQFLKLTIYQWKIYFS